MNKKFLICSLFIIISISVILFFINNKNTQVEESQKIEDSSLRETKENDNVIEIKENELSELSSECNTIIDKEIVRESNSKKFKFLDFDFVCKENNEEYYGKIKLDGVDCDFYYKDDFIKNFKNVSVRFNNHFNMISFLEAGLGASFLNTRYIINGKEELVEMPSVIPQHGSSINYAYDSNDNFIIVYKTSDFNSEFDDYAVYNKEGVLIPKEYLDCSFSYFDEKAQDFSVICEFYVFTVSHKKNGDRESVESAKREESPKLVRP